jgi:hypothetical protein
MYRQGDVLLREIDELTSDAQPEKDQERARVLVRSEKTGHAHVLSDGAIYRAAGPNGPKTLIELAQPARLIHDEHAALEIPAGIYQLVRQRTYEPLAAPPVAPSATNAPPTAERWQSNTWASRFVDD